MAHQAFISIGGHRLGPLPFNEAMRQLFALAVQAGVRPELYRECLPQPDRWKIWVARQVNRHGSLVAACYATPQAEHRRTFDPGRYFIREQEVVYDPSDANTVFVMSTQWGFAPDGRNRNEFLPRLQAVFPHLRIDVSV
jgi:hypothetical protein